MAKWAYQMTPWDAWDYDGINEHILIDMTIGGKATKALIHFDRNGFAYLLDRANGTLLWPRSSCPPQLGRADRFEDGPARRRSSQAHEAGRRHQRHLSGAMGAKDQQPVSYSPQTKLIYAGTNNICMNYEGVEVQYIAGAPYVGATCHVPRTGRIPRRVHGLGSGCREEGLGDQGAVSRRGPERS